MPTLDISLEICDTEVEMSHERFITPDGKWQVCDPPEMGWEPVDDIKRKKIAKGIGNASIVPCDETGAVLHDFPDLKGLRNDDPKGAA